MPSSIIRMGTRGSLLARMQSAMVAKSIEALHPGLRVETVLIKTTGDQITDRPLYDAGGKGLFVKEIEQALLDNQIDLAVHSAKDLPVTMPLVDQAGLTIAAVPKRHDPRDLLISPKAKNISDLPEGASVATGSLRRRCQLLSLRPDLRIDPIRGNIDTRLKKIRAGQSDALILALAGIDRAGLWDETWMHLISTDELLPAAAQGALALQCRRDDRAIAGILEPLNDPDSAACIAAERQIVAGLNGDCHSPIAALAEISAAQMRLRVVVGARDGGLPIFSAQATGLSESPEQIVAQVLGELKKHGIQHHLHGR